MLFNVDYSLRNTPGIYQITNSVNSKVYVGSSKKLAHRFATHLKQLTEGRHHAVLLQRFVDKYGIDKLAFSLLESCTVNQLIEREQVYIDSLNAHSARGGYNSSPTARSPLGVKHSAETNARNAARKMGNTNRLGITHTPETRAKMSASKKGKMTGAAQIEGMRQANLTKRVYPTGHTLSAESIAKRQATRAVRRAEVGSAYDAKSEQARRNMSAARMGIKPTPEALAKREATKAARRAERGPEYGAMPANWMGRTGQKGHKLSPESIAKRTATFKANRAARQVA